MTTSPKRCSARTAIAAHFKTDIYEFSLVYEFHLYREELGHVYDLRGVQGTESYILSVSTSSLVWVVSTSIRKPSSRILGCV